MTQLEKLYPAAAKAQKEAVLGIMTLFSYEEKNEGTQEVAETAPSAPTFQMLKKEKELLGFYLSGHPLDQFRDHAKKLSCMPLINALEMDHDAAFRSIFIIESLQVKLASKSGRKFAILTISDGDMTQELPIWSDLYEAKAPLFQEAKLLYAILAVDKRDSVPKLQCKWIEYLLSVDEAAIKSCDLAYYRLKDSKETFRRFPAPKAEEKKKQVLTLQIQLKAVRLSHILELKKKFRENSGGSPVVIRFLEETSNKGELHIDAIWGVTISPKLEYEVKNIPSVIGFSVESSP